VRVCQVRSTAAVSSRPVRSICATPFHRCETFQSPSPTSRPTRRLLTAPPAGLLTLTLTPPPAADAPARHRPLGLVPPPELLLRGLIPLPPPPGGRVIITPPPPCIFSIANHEGYTEIYRVMTHMASPPMARSRCGGPSTSSPSAPPRARPTRRPPQTTALPYCNLKFNVNFRLPFDRKYRKYLYGNFPTGLGQSFQVGPAV
jgi:hypothetical protein